MKTLLLIFLLCAGNSLAQETALIMPNINAVMEQAEEKASELKLPENQHERAGQDAAKALVSKFQSSDYQAKIRQEQQRLQHEVFKDVPAQVKANDPGDSPNAKSEQSTIYLFISSSVPITTLRSHAAMIDHARTTRIVLVLRGFVDGMKKVKPTMNFIGEILKKDKDCEISQERCDSYQANIQIDPTLFQKFTIEEVPALLFQKNNQSEPMIIQGDASLDYLLGRINREVKEKELENLIAALRGGINSGGKDVE